MSMNSVTVLTGYLGAGKAMLLKRILTELYGKKYAVLVNKYGKVGLLKTTRILFAFAAFLFFPISVQASSGNEDAYEINWKNPQEVLLYHSSGCGDDCWIVDLKERETQKTKIELSCDGEKLYVSYGENGKNTLYKNTCIHCDAVNCKSIALVEEMEHLISPETPRPFLSEK